LVAHKRSFELAELTRSRLIQLARKLRLFHSPQHTPQLYASLPPNPADLWLVWIDMETRKRLGLGIYLVDSLFPVFLDIPASVPKGEMLDAAFPCDERFWAACNPDEWKSFVGHGILPPTAYFVNG
jgi:hypothetical protein